MLCGLINYKNKTFIYSWYLTKQRNIRHEQQSDDLKAEIEYYHKKNQEDFFHCHKRPKKMRRQVIQGQRALLRNVIFKQDSPV